VPFSRSFAQITNSFKCSNKRLNFESERVRRKNRKVELTRRRPKNERELMNSKNEKFQHGPKEVVSKEIGGAEYKGGHPKIAPYLHPTSEGALTLDVEPQIPLSNSNSQAFVSSAQGDRYPSGFWRRNERPMSLGFVRVRSCRHRPRSLAFQTTGATTGTEITIMPSLLLPDHRSSTSIYQCQADTKSKNEHELLLTNCSGEDEDDGGDDNMTYMERWQRTLHVITSRSSQPQVELSPTRSTIPSNPLSSNTYLESIWSDAGNGSAAGRTQRETTSPGRTLCRNHHLRLRHSLSTVSIHLRSLLAHLGIRCSNFR
jgi:hypothetical protein